MGLGNIRETEGEVPVQRPLNRSRLGGGSNRGHPGGTTTEIIICGVILVRHLRASGQLTTIVTILYIFRKYQNGEGSLFMRPIDVITCNDRFSDQTAQHPRP